MKWIQGSVGISMLICVILFLAFRSDVLKNDVGNIIVQAREIIEKVVPNIADQSTDGAPTENTADAALFAQQLDSGEGETDNQSENLLIPHQIGSEYPFEESSGYSAEDGDIHVRLFIQGGELPLGD